MTVRRPGSAWGRFVAAALALAVTGAGLAAVAPPAAAAPADTAGCDTALDCLYLTTLVDLTSPVPERTYDLRPVEGDILTGGAFQIAVHASGPQQCLANVAGTGPTAFLPCSADPRTHWHIRPSSGAPVAEYDVIDPTRWNPWMPAGAGRHTFSIISATRALTAPATCLTGRLASALVLPCSTDARFSWVLPTFPNDPSRAQKTAAQQAEVTRSLLTSAFHFSLLRCSLPPGTACQTQLAETSTGVDLTGWRALGQAALVRRPTPASRVVGCRGGVGEEAVHNDTDQPIEQELGVSATSALTASVSDALSAEVEGSVAAMVGASGGLSFGTAYGKTWARATGISGSTTHTLPPHQYATAVLSRSTVSARTSWRFDAGTFRPWSIAGVVDLEIPYASSGGAPAPDTTLVVHDSWAPKACSALAPSTLSEGYGVAVVNVTAPNQTAVVGDVVTADAEPWWWDTGASSDPVTFRYQWYRQRGAEQPVAIAGANGRTYRVTGDDVASTAAGTPYVLSVGVTDVAGVNRFDSVETMSDINVTTQPQTVTRTTLTSSAPASVVAGRAITLTAKVVAADRARTRGTVRFYAGSRLLGTRPLNAAGAATLTGVRLPGGTTRLVARFSPTDRVDAASASPIRVQKVQYRSMVTIGARPTTARTGAKLLVGGRVRVVAKPRAAFAGQKVAVLVDGKVATRTKLTRSGAFTVSVPASRLKRGTHRVEVSYGGSRPGLVAPSISKAVIIRRR